MNSMLHLSGFSQTETINMANSKTLASSSLDRLLFNERNLAACLPLPTEIYILTSIGRITYTNQLALHC